VSDSATVVFLDANVIAKRVTRTFLLAGGLLSGFIGVWSHAAEGEAARHMRPRATPPAVIRERFGIPLGPTGQVGGRFGATSMPDRQILADAEVAGAAFLVTEDVDDFAVPDLVAAGISAVNPDLFLAERMTHSAYRALVALFVERQVAPPTTAEDFHRSIGREHPRLFAAHADLYPVAPAVAVDRPPAVVFRGTRCLRCETKCSAAKAMTDGVCPECLGHH
jgi:hypothetical protein